MIKFQVKAAHIRQFFKRAQEAAHDHPQRDRKYMEGYLDAIIDLTGHISDPKGLNDYASDDAHAYLETGRWPKQR